MADEYTYATSIAPQETEFQFSNRQYVWISDNNNSSYPSGQVIFDLASISNSGKFVDWKQSYLTVPLVLNLNATAGAFATANVENVFAASLKNHIFHLINSMSVEITNNAVVGLTNFSNLDINYKILNRISSEEVSNLGPSIFFCKDTAESIGYAGVSGGIGLGEHNNVIKAQTFASTNGWGQTSMTQNAGRQARMLYTSFDPTATQAAKFTTASYCNTVAKNYATYSTSNITFHIMATIPLRLMHDIFDKLPLAKGIYMRLILNLNAQSQVVLNTDGAAYTGIASVSSPNGVLPFQISPMGTGNGFVATGATQITASLGIGKSVVPTTINHASGITQCRVYCAVYDMSPLYEEKFLSMVPTKTIKYNDILSFQVTNVQGGASFSQILTNGVSRARYLLICPQLSSVVNGATTILNTTTNSNFQLGSPMNSPFSSAPGTCCPFAFVNNFNVLVSGSAIYQSNYNYRYEQFLQEIRPSQGLNGGLSLGMSSGIIGQSDWENAYGWIYVDLSRKISQASDDISRSIQIVGTNASGVNVDYYCIIGYEREITLSTATGSLVI